MKVTKQNGAIHGLARREVEAAVTLVPPAWSSRVEQVVLYQGDGPSLTTTYYPKEKTLGLFWPVPQEVASKADGLRELLLALSVVHKRGELPSRLSPAIRRGHLEDTSQLLQRCLVQIVSNAP